MLSQRRRLVQASFQCAAVALTIAAGAAGIAEDESPTLPEAPAPLSPEDSLKCVTLPAGFQLELVVSEPLISSPSGVCWDERGRLFVCELHGYNLEGQYDVDELNKTGEVDREVRRIQANERAKEAAQAGTYGAVKLLEDKDGDARMDAAHVWADDLPPCYGICPARGGVIVACAPDIVFLADRDNDGRAEIREVLFTGFVTGALERGISAPQWGIDGWIYVSGGHGGGTITGPRLAGPVELPNSDFRIRADGSAIEPVMGRTGTFGFAFDESGNRIITSTQSPSLVAPLPWRYLVRNRDAAVSSLQQRLFGDIRVYPTSRPHPWRTERAHDPGFSKFYTDRYGVEESAPNGYFTSACSPLVYLDSALPGLHGQLFLCEPAQNLVHRERLEPHGPSASASRLPEEATSEFLASSDAWFHPISLAHGPDGAVWIVDYYREIIEDYSAIPRYLQQHYGLVNGEDRGRIYRLVHREMPEAQSADMAGLSPHELADEVQSESIWRRTTARRLLVERQQQAEKETLERIARTAERPSAAVDALYALDELNSLSSQVLMDALAHSSPMVRVHALRLADRKLHPPELADAICAMAGDEAAVVQLQLALSLGEIDDARAIPLLAQLARNHGETPWMLDAVLCSLSGRGSLMLAELLAMPRDASPTAEASQPIANLQAARGLLEPLCAAIAARRDPDELARTLTCIARLADAELQSRCLRGLLSRLPASVSVVLGDEARASLRELAQSSSDAVKEQSQKLFTILRLESAAERESRLSQALADVGDIQLPLADRLAAVAQIAADGAATQVGALLETFAENTPPVQAAILEAAFARTVLAPRIVDALEREWIPAAALSTLERQSLTEHPDENLSQRARKVLEASPESIGDVALYLAALDQPRDLRRGEQVFRNSCGTCHQAHGIGHAVGPDLASEFQRAEETIVRDILAPSDAITSGYATFVVQTIEGRVLTGLIAEESATSILLRQAEGKNVSVLRKDVETLRTSTVSLMPADLSKTLTPQDVANVVAWLRQPPTSATLVDEDPQIVAALESGDGVAELDASDAWNGATALRITPMQRYSPQVNEWSFVIRERPKAGEFRFLRFAWKSAGASGVMIELANQRRWPAENSRQFRYVAGRNSTGWQAIEVAPQAPEEWTVVTRDLWKDCGDATITGISFVAMEGAALFDQVELLRDGAGDGE